MADHLTEINDKNCLTKQIANYKCSAKHIFSEYSKNHRIYEEPGDPIFFYQYKIIFRSLVPGLFHCVSPYE